MKRFAIRWLAPVLLGCMTLLSSAVGQPPVMPAPSGAPGAGGAAGQPAVPQGPVNNAERSSVLQYGFGLLAVLGVLVIVCAPSRKQIGGR